MSTDHPNGAPQVATQVRVELARQNLNQSDLARKLGKHQQWVQRRLSGETRITVEDVVAVASALNIPPATLLPSDKASA